MIDDGGVAQSEHDPWRRARHRVRPATHQAGPLGRDEADTQCHVVTVVVVFEVQFGALALGDREGESLARRRGAVDRLAGGWATRAAVPAWACARIPACAVAMVGRTSPDAGTGENVGWVTLRDYTATSRLNLGQPTLVLRYAHRARLGSTSTGSPW